MAKRILLLFFAWRILLFIPIIAGFYFLPLRVGYDYTLLTYFLPKESFLNNFLLYPFGNFDAVYYLQIAAGGYTVNAGFFPLFPLIIFLASFPFSNLNYQDLLTVQFFIGIILVSLFFVLSLIILYRLVRLDFKSNIAILTILAILAFPTSFFYAAIYSESLFLLLSLLTFYFARKKKWLFAGITGGLLTATRLVGIAILPALLYEYFKSEKKLSFKIFSFFLVPIGLLSYVFYNFLKWGNPFYFIEVQGNLMNNRAVDTVILLPQTIFRYIKILFTVNPNIYEWWIAFFELSFAIFAVSMLFTAWKKKVRFSYLLFGILCFLIPASSGTLSAIPRYIVVIFPIFMALALIKNKWFRIAYGSISVILLFLFFTLFSKGYFIS